MKKLIDEIISSELNGTKINFTGKVSSMRNCGIEVAKKYSFCDDEQNKIRYIITNAKGKILSTGLSKD